MKTLVTILLIAFPLMLVGQHTISIHTGYGHELKFDQQTGENMTSPRSFSVGASYSFVKKVCDLTLEAGLDFMIFGYVYEFQDQNSFGVPAVFRDTEFGYLSFSSITNVVLRSRSFLPRWSLVIGPGVNYSPSIDGDVQYHDIDVNNRQPPRPENLFLAINMDNERTPLSLLARAALRYDASRRIQVRLGMEHFLTSMAKGNYRFHNRSQGYGNVEVRPTFMRLALGCKF